MAATPPVCEFDWPAPDFTLPGIDGQRHALSDLRGKNGTVVMFICNHCPFVLAILDKIIRDARDLEAHGISTIAICSNDAEAYPADSFDNMRKLAQEHGFPFAYLHDESQQIARAYDAACTPDFFGFNTDLKLQYRGRLDASRRNGGDLDLPRDLYEAMVQVAQTGKGPAEQPPSMGCSIKWKS